MEPDISIWGGPLEGPVLQQGELSMVCVGLSERDLLRLYKDNFTWLYSVQRHIIMFRLSDLAGMTRKVALQSIS